MPVIIPSISGFPLGLSARKSIGLTVAGQLTRVTFRVRRNNGAAGGIAGEVYQECMTYYTPSNPQTPAQQANRATFTAGVAAWQALTENQKDVYRKRSTRLRFATGFTLYMSEYMFSH